MRKLVLLTVLLTGCNSLFENPTSPTAVDPGTDDRGGSTKTEAPQPIDTSGYANDVIRLTNQVRNSPRGCGPGGASLRKNSQLTRAAQLHSEDMDENNYFSHTGRDGSSPSDRARRAGYNSSFIGENIAINTTPDAVMQAWLNSPGHCRNIMNPDYNHIGVGYSNGYWTMVLGRG